MRCLPPRIANRLGASGFTAEEIGGLERPIGSWKGWTRWRALISSRPSPRLWPPATSPRWADIFLFPQAINTERAGLSLGPLAEHRPHRLAPARPFPLSPAMRRLPAPNLKEKNHDRCPHAVISSPGPPPLPRRPRSRPHRRRPFGPLKQIVAGRFVDRLMPKPVRPNGPPSSSCCMAGLMIFRLFAEVAPRTRRRRPIG